MRTQLTLGSLFDGIGGFPLAGLKAGIRPVWASEIEPFPMLVTTKRLPDMAHLGNICNLHGGELEPVDIITFGSPCQNLSIAGNRAGLSGMQSSLFFEAMRVIQEMRRATNGKQPRWAVWENVPGALSSRHGQDFRDVLENLACVKDLEAVVSMPEKCRWLPAGEIMGDGWSLAWRILDASKGWGVAQRRRRIFVVVDFDGQCAGQVLFESEGLSGYTPPGTKAGQGAAEASPSGAGEASKHVVSNHDGLQMDVTNRSDRVGGGKDALVQNHLSSTLGCHSDQTRFARKVYGISSDQSNGMLSENPHSGIYEADSIRTLDCNGGNPCCNQGGTVVVEAYALQGSMIGREDNNGPQGDGVNREVSFTLNTVDRHAVMVEQHPRDDQIDEACPDDTVLASGERTVGTLMANAGTKLWLGNQEAFCGSYFPIQNHCIRRLTPGECCRLQGYPDGWSTDLGTPDPTEHEIAWWSDVFEGWRKVEGKSKKPKTPKQIAKWLRDPHRDAAEYKAYGNSVAVPCVFFVLAGIAWVEGMEG